jgi:hypothetical protein
VADNPYSPPTAAIGPDESDLVSRQVSIVCPDCRAAIHLGDEACSGCRRQVTKGERAALQRRWEASDGDVARASEKGYWGRVALALAAALATVHGVLLLAVFELGAVALVIGVILWVVFVVSLWRPLEAAVAGLAVYSLWWLGQLVFTTLLAFDGFGLRLLILLALITSAGAEWNMKRRREAVVRARR